MSKFTSYDVVSGDDYRRGPLVLSNGVTITSEGHFIWQGSQDGKQYIMDTDPDTGNLGTKCSFHMVEPSQSPDVKAQCKR